MGLSLLNPMPDAQAELRRVQQELFARNKQLNEAQEELRGLRNEMADERRKNIAIEAGVSELRTVLTPLYQALQHIFGVTEGIGTEPGHTSPPPTSKNSAAWEQWKQRLGGATARAIDALMVHGEMNQTQLRIILGCATRTVTNVVTALNQAKLIDKRDGKISLKEL